jgi:hypothetical protein
MENIHPPRNGIEPWPTNPPPKIETMCVPISALDEFLDDIRAYPRYVGHLPLGLCS